MRCGLGPTGAGRLRDAAARGSSPIAASRFVLAVPGVAEFAASFKSPITSSPPKWMAELENDDIDMLKELGSLTTANLMEKVRGLQNLAYQLGLDESREMTRGKFLNILEKPKK
ncbi:PREDICTED: protein lin-52 homolog [Nestor notabilis]|uniref:protein lin-52 homolog n=1 Tax=Nestor notabilis TaxID=176057 RepID=UPI0005238305|nr:PREDICTED: protein lin-52 homolog [Nestor notabilis]